MVHRAALVTFLVFRKLLYAFSCTVLTCVTRSLWMLLQYSWSADTWKLVENTALSPGFRLLHTAWLWDSFLNMRSVTKTAQYRWAIVAFLGKDLKCHTSRRLPDVILHSSLVPRLHPHAEERGSGYNTTSRSTQRRSCLACEMTNSSTVRVMITRSSRVRNSARL